MKKKLLKITALVLAINFLTSTLAPTLMYALTAGPTAPEYTSFEPIDTTDMVNLATGDFTYNIPLLEVPGPEGGYPLALSYHAGISPEEESSWIGLGWSLNAGAINRIVNVHPDDMNNSTIAIHDTWSGGEAEIYSVGVGVGIGNAVNVGVGVDFANDTYKGSGTGVSANIDLGRGIGNNARAGIGISAGLGPYGGGYVGVGLTAGTSGDGVNVAGSIGLSASFGNSETHLSGTAGTSVSYSKGYGETRDAAGNMTSPYISSNGFSLIGANISTNGGRASLSPAGISATAVGDNSSDVTTKSSGFSIPIPIPYTPLSINLGYHKTRYYTDAFSHEEQIGVLYTRLQDGSKHGQSYDSYFFKSALSTTPFLDKENQKGGGSMPAYDSYSVLAQGLSGAIQPYLFEGGTISRKLKWNNTSAGEQPDLLFSFDPSFKPYDLNKKVSFRFINDFSNSMVVNADALSGTTLDSFKITDANYQIGKNQLGYLDQYDFNSVTGALAGSKHVEWFTNTEINTAFTPASNGTYPNQYLAKGFIPNLTNRNAYFSNGIYGNLAGDHIGGFMVTNASGVNYHYAQPVYNFEETQNSYSKSFSNSSEEVYSSRRIEKNIPYAYSWLLTGITGPDYVDRGIIGQIDEADWGYWVKFEYGKWTDEYIWRTPNEGTNKDTYSGWQSWEAGKKQLYYLDAIITRTHTALFVKDIRMDGKGVKEKENGGFGISRDANQTVTNCSAASLKLSRILLFNNRTLSKAMEQILSINPLNTDGTQKVLAFTRDELKQYGAVPAQGTSAINNTLHYWDNVLTENDLVSTTGTIASRASRQVVMEQDYSLCGSTPNSINIDYTNFTTPAQTQSGKLTLLKVHFLGYEGKKIVPPTVFTYYNPADYDKYKKDVWGMYKSDYVPEFGANTTYQNTTQASAPYVHAWSLTGISTGVGADIEIEYESDSYKTLVLGSFYNFPTTSTMPVTGNTSQEQIFLKSSEPLTNIPELNQPNATVTFDFAFAATENSTADHPAYIELVGLNPSIPVRGVGADYIILDRADIKMPLFNDLASTSTNTDWRYQFLMGNVKFNRNADTETFGGGLRVASISLKADGIVNKTKYEYMNGTTSYEPFDVRFNMPFTRKLSESNVGKDLINRLYKDYINIVSNTAFLPSPGVIYDQVVVSEEVIDETQTPMVTIPGVNYTTYKFTTFNNNMMPRTEGTKVDLGNDKYVKKVTFKDFRNFIGALKEITLQSSADNRVLSYTQNNYLHNLVTDYTNNYDDTLAAHYNNQGRIEHLYYEKMDQALSTTEQLFITEIEEYPIVPLGQRSENRKTGIIKETKTIGFDYYTGMPLATWHQDGMGNDLLAVSTPAYNISQYNEMGLKVINSANKHMLSQQAASKTFVVTPNVSNPLKETDFTKIGVMTASVQTWFKNGTGIVYPVTTLSSQKNYSSQGIWLKGTNYSWLGSDTATLKVDGRYPYNSFIDFDFSSSVNPQWQMQEEVTTYDVYSHALEGRDLLNKYSSVLMDPLNIQVTATASLASRSEIAYSGAEFDSYYPTAEGNVSFGDGAATINNAHTGKNSLAVGGGNMKGYTFSFTPQSSRKYHASVWVFQPGGINALGTSAEFKPRLIAKNTTTGVILATGLPSESKKARGFYLLSINIIPSNYTDEIEVYCLNENSDSEKPQYYDDFRVHPLDAGFKSYVYDLDKGWLTYILDGDNFYTRFEYDHAGKLKAVYKELFRINEKIVTSNTYNYGR